MGNAGKGRSRARARVLVASVALACLACAEPAFAAEPVSPPAPADRTPDGVPADRVKDAADEFDRGRAAFLAKDFSAAATFFANAYRAAPRAESLRLAIRAHREAKELARAATLAAIAVERHGSDAATARMAKETLDEAAAQLHRVDVDCAAECAVTADGRVLSQLDATHHRLYVDPGPHELGVGFARAAGGGSLARHLDAVKAGHDVLTFEPPPLPPAASPPAAPPAGPAASGDARPLPPAVFFVAAGLTLGLAAATAISGVAAQESPGVDAVRRACAGKDESCPAYQDGQAAETRTNVLLAAAVTAAVATGVIGVFFTRWPRAPASPKVGAALLPGGAAASFTARF